LWLLTSCPVNSKVMKMFVQHKSMPKKLKNATLFPLQ
jgi:hypothetical protein